jgi:hypothetical protein
MLDVILQEYNGNDLWYINIKDPFPGKNMNMNLLSKGRPISGFGIYSIAYKTNNFGNRIIYLGKYAGIKDKSKDDALAGDVRDRWFKHVGSATLLLRNLKMSSQASFLHHKNKIVDFFSSDPDYLKIASTSFMGLNEKILKDHVFIKGADLQISKNRLGFALQILKDTNKSTANNKDELEQILSRFTFYYWQLASKEPIKKSEINMKLTGQKNKIGVESEIIKRYCEKLPMNKEFTPTDNYYHFDPESLIRTDSVHFEEYSTFIKSKIKNIIINNNKTTNASK